MRENITDRAQRYRAQNAIEQEDRICVFCGSTGDVMVGHINGNESDGDPANLAYTCRPCNVSIGIFMARNGFGRRTVQFNPKDFGAQKRDAYKRVLLDKNLQGSLLASVAKQYLERGETKPTRARDLNFRQGSLFNPAGGARSLGQWVVAVTSMKGSGPIKLADAVEIVRATSPEKRSQYAREIWRLRRSHGTDKTGVPF
jgi:hypothetical protein